MKKQYLGFIISFLLFATNVVATEKITISPASSSVAGAEGTLQIAINTNQAWSAVCNQKWAKVNPSSGTGNATITVTYDSNVGLSSRSAAIIFSSNDGFSQAFILNQNVSKNLILNPEKQTISATQKQITFEINTALKWTASSTQTWAKINPTSGLGKATITVSCEDNLSNEIRDINIIVKTEAGSKTTTILQNVGKFVVLGSTVKKLTDKGGVSTIFLKSNDDWTLSSEQNWLKVSPTSGKGDAILRLTYDVNKTDSIRSATINLSNSVGKVSATFEQMVWKSLSVPTSTRLMSEKASYQTLDIQTELEWTVSSSRLFAKVSPEKGKGMAVITINFDANPSNKVRTTDIKVITSDSNVQTITINQDFVKTLQVNPKQFDLVANDGKATFQVLSNSNWTVSSEQAWIIIPQNVGTANSSFTINYLKNPTNQYRKATLVISDGQNKTEIQLLQAANGAVKEDNWIRFVTLTPNLNEGNITVNCPNSYSKNTRLELYNTSSEILFTQALLSEQTVVDITKLNKGVYFAKIISGEQAVVKRFVKQ